MCTWHRLSTYTQVELFPEPEALVLFEHPIIMDIRINTVIVIFVFILLFVFSGLSVSH